MPSTGPAWVPVYRRRAAARSPSTTSSTEFVGEVGTGGAHLVPVAAEPGPAAHLVAERAAEHQVGGEHLIDQRVVPAVPDLVVEHPNHAHPGPPPNRGPSGTTTTPSRPGPACAPIAAPTSEIRQRRASGNRAHNRSASSAARVAAPRWCTARSADPAHSGLRGQLDQAHRGPRRRPDLLQRHDPPVRDVQQRLHRQRGAEQRRRGADPPAAPQVLEGVDAEEDPAARCHVRRGALHLPAGQAGSQRRRRRRAPRSPAPSRSSASRPPAPVRTDLRGGPHRGLPGAGQLAGQVHGHHLGGPAREGVAVAAGERLRPGPGRAHRGVPPGQLGGELGRPDVDTVQPDPVSQPHGQRNDPDAALLRQPFGEVRGGVGDDGDRHRRTLFEGAMRAATRASQRPGELPGECGADGAMRRPTPVHPVRVTSAGEHEPADERRQVC